MTSPIIGITRDCDAENESPSYRFYRDSVDRAGGEPLPLFFRDSLGEVGAVLDGLDGLLLSGGDDLDPSLYGQPLNPNARLVDPRRQRWEIALIAEADRRGIPVLGICLGCQIINVHRGGSLHQFLPELPGKLEHRKLGDVVLRHDVSIEAGSLLAQTVGSTQVKVNTYHKQAVKRVGRDLRVVAHAPDGTIEGVEDVSRPLFLGVQWHPERISTEPAHAALFSLLTTRARDRAMVLARR